MSSTEEWCADKLSNLLNEELRISTLNEIKDHLSSLPSHEVKPLVNSLDLPLVFDCLNDSNSEQVDLACNVLSLCFDNLNIGESANRYGISMERALAHPYSSVKLMVLKELERNVKNDDVLIDLCKRTSLLSSIIKCIGSDDLEVASKACNILTIFGGSDIGIKQLITQNSIDVFNEVMNINDIKRLRVFELFVNISKESKTSFDFLNGAGLIEPILNDLKDEDVLLRMNIYEILLQLGLSEHGYKYLEIKNVFKDLSQILKNGDELTLQLTGPGIIKLFGCMGHWKPKEIIQNYSYVIIKLFENFDKLDIIFLGVSLDAIGYIGSTNDGKCALDSLGMVEKSLKILSKRIGSLSTETTIKVFQCIENLLKIDNNDNVQISLICRKWFFSICDNTMNDLILKYAKNPFSELRVVGLNVILAISNQIWGQEVIKDTPGLIEFLLDRNSETHKVCKEIKYDIVKTLSKSSVFDQNVINNFNNYVKEGVFYVQGVMEVALE